MKSDIADLKNTGGRAAGTLTAAAFLREFVDSTPWVHLDIAGTAYLDNDRRGRQRARPVRPCARSSRSSNARRSNVLRQAQDDKGEGVRVRQRCEGLPS